MNILHIDASPLGSASISRQLSAAVVERLKRDNPAATVIHRDLTATPISHLSGEVIQVLRPAPGSAPPTAPTLRAEADQTDALISELLGADVLVFGVPMINFSIPSQLKAWIDRVAQAGRTFRYTAAGPEGLAVGKKAIIVSTRGGFYAGTAYETAMDHQEAYLRTVLNFLGITDVTYVRAEGIAVSAEKKQEALVSATRQIAELQVDYPRAA
ncbi:MAG: FMN-dependent NADH-azoreductase [Gammaproteobacteria bacterium]